MKDVYESMNIGEMWRMYMKECLCILCLKCRQIWMMVIKKNDPSVCVCICVFKRKDRCF